MTITTASMQGPPARGSTTAVRQGQLDFAVRGRLSSFFYGTSVLTNRPIHPLCECKTPHSRLPDMNTSRLDIYHINTPAPVIRSRSSTRSMIDPSSSPVDSARPLPRETFDIDLQGFDAPERAHAPSPALLAHMDLEQQNLTGWRRRHHGLSEVHRRKKRSKCFPNAANKAVKSKVVSCLASGIILAVVLTTCPLHFKSCSIPLY